MKKPVLVTIFTLLATVFAHANVTIESTSYQEQIKTTVEGEKITTWVEAKKVMPGSVVKYVNMMTNHTKQNATKLVVNNPIPKNMEFIQGSASCLEDCTISYSVDGGRHFMKASELYIGTKDDEHLAKASEYTNIRWVLSVLNKKSKSSVEYKARLK